MENLFDVPGVELSCPISLRNFIKVEEPFVWSSVWVAIPRQRYGYFPMILRFYSFPFDNCHFNRSLIRNGWFSQMIKQPNDLDLVDFFLMLQNSVYAQNLRLSILLIITAWYAGQRAPFNQNPANSMVARTEHLVSPHE